jgi:hypothetical protein
MVKKSYLANTLHTFNGISMVSQNHAHLNKPTVL